MRPVISVERKIRFGKTVLNYLFDLLPLRKEPARDSRDLATMPFEQLLKGRFVISEERARNIVRETEWKVRRFESCLQGKKR